MPKKKQKRSRRRRSRTRHPLVRNLRWGVTWGFWYGAFYSVFALLAFAVSGGRGIERLHLHLAGVIIFYFLAGVLSGAIVGALRRFTRNRLGAIMVGIVAAYPVSFGALVMLEGPFTSWESDLWILTVILSFAFGLVGALGVWKKPK